jgi:nucleotide-binding universal stress UspA family protein
VTRKILFATDGSDHAEATLQWIIDNLNPQNHTIEILSISDNVRMQHLTESSAYTEIDELLDWVDTQTSDIVQETQERLKSHGFESTTHTRVGDPGPIICDLAEELDIDQVIMSRRGRGRVGELLLGSVSQYVLHHAPVAVTITPPDLDAE